jgi:hypothetical protein
MNYTTLSIRKNNRIRKYILFYADFLQEAWLSEVKENDTTKIVRQFKCKNTDDLQDLTADLSRMGEIVNLTSDETIEQHLAVLDMKLEKPYAEKVLDSLSTIQAKLSVVWSVYRKRGSLRHA